MHWDAGRQHFWKWLVDTLAVKEEDHHKAAAAAAGSRPSASETTPLDPESGLG